MIEFKRGNRPHSYLIRIWKLKIRFRNIFAFKNNKILLTDDNGKERRINRISGLKIKFYGENATVRFHSPCPKFKNSKIICYDNVLVNFNSSGKKSANLSIFAQSDGGSINIGKNVKFRGGYVILQDDKDLHINIGDNCLIADHVKIRTTDFHTVFDRKTKKPLNKPASVNIGKHCWICEDVTISKGTNLPDNTIVAAKSFVSKSFEKPNTIIGGIPARIIKDNNTGWEESPYDKYVESLA